MQGIFPRGLSWADRNGAAVRPAATPMDRDFSRSASLRARVPISPPFRGRPRGRYLRQQFEARIRDDEARFAAAENAVVLRDGEPVGQLWVDRSDEEVRMLDVALLPEHRGAGVGTNLLTGSGRGAGA